MVIAFLMMNPFHHRFHPNEDMGGEYNGYVGFNKDFNKDLPFSSINGECCYDESLDYLVSVHGGITFDRTWGEMKDASIIPLTSIPAPEELKDYRVIGFDTLHYGDTRERWPIEKVKEETLNLMHQIEKLIERKQ